MKLITTVALLLAVLTVNAQDVHFSQTHAAPTSLNPAMTGLFSGNLRLIANYRSQWNDFTNGFYTASGAADFKLRQVKKYDYFSGGVQIYKDIAGDLEFSTSYAGLSFSYLKSLDRKGQSFISMGMQTARYSNSVDYSKIIANHEEPLIQGGAPDQIGYWDVSAGIAWFYALSRYNSVSAGIALAHINEPEVSFLGNIGGSAPVLKYTKITIHGGAALRIGANCFLKPSFVFQDQGPHREMIMGTFWQFKGGNYHDQEKPSLYLGGWARWYTLPEQKDVGVDALIFAIRMDYKDYELTFSFDANVSSLRSVSAGNGATEFSIIKTFDWSSRSPQRGGMTCPAFKY